MQKIMKAIRLLLLVLAGVGILIVSVNNYSYIFSRTVKGEVMEIDKAGPGAAVISGPLSAAQMFSMAVAVRQADGEIVTASSEDRQWAVVHKGICVEAVFYPYPPWILGKGGTYFNARLVRMMECGGAAASAAGIAPSAGQPMLLPPSSPSLSSESAPTSTPALAPVPASGQASGPASGPE